MVEDKIKLYIAVHDEFPDFMTPTLVAHSVLGAHLKFQENSLYQYWLKNYFNKCVVRVNQKEFDNIIAIPETYVGYEKHTMFGNPSCAIPLPVLNKNLPNVLKFAKLWKPLTSATIIHSAPYA